MICTEKERETCNVEKMGCMHCFYNKPTEHEIEELIQELTEVRPSNLKPEALKLFNTITAILDERKELKREIEELKREIEELKVQRDYYKREYSLYNKALEEAGKVLTKNNGG